MSSGKLKSMVLGLILGGILCSLPAGGQTVASVPDPVAKINGQSISRETFLNRLIAYHGVYVLQNLFGEMLLEAEAKKRGVSITDQELAARIDETRKRYGIVNPESFRSWLAQQEATENSFRDRQRLTLLVEKTFASDANVTAAEVETFYNQNKATFTIPANITYWVLVTRTEELAQKALQLIKGGKDFPTAAKELGANMASASGPRAEAIKAIPPFYRVALERATPGQFVGPLKMPQDPKEPNSPAVGYSVIKVTAKEPQDRVRPFAEVKDEIRRGLFSERIFGTYGIWESWNKQAMKEANIERLLTFKGEPAVTK